MNEKQAKELLDYTFNKEFDFVNFSNLLKELLNTSNLYKQDKTQFIDKQFKNYILNVIKLGQYKDVSNKSVEILAVKLATHSSLDRARTMQRNFISTWLSKNSNEPVGALVAFYSDEKDWRFSFVKLEYNLMKDQKGNLKAQKEQTPAKRYSFLVGPNEPNHTCKSQFVHLLVDDHDPTLKEIEKAFGIEKVTKEFFENYQKRYWDLRDSLERVIKRDANVKEEFMRIVQNDEEELKNFVVEFSKKLLGQIVFLYFLQKKGWLGVGIYDKWGTGPKDFMRRLFGGGKQNYKPLVKYDNFFNDILEPLFYDTLARKRDGDYCKFGNVAFKIPFLNGGLFEPLDGYKWEATDITIDDNIFKDILNTFDEFNFTVKEDEPLEKEVAVDPEMLGKVFENLLDVSDRKSKGAFYTPREIVHYMCQQSLINYLETNTSISREDIEIFIEMGDITTSNDERILIQIKEKQEKVSKGIISSAIFAKEVEELSNQLNLPKSIVQNKEPIDKLLKDIKVVDPAVGSGAFPMGMMNEIVNARSILSLFFSEERNVYDIKRECIENSLYGVDIMPSAVDICQLRFWLSLIVDEEDKDKVKPLPNLDNKIMCGNSLLEEFEGVKLFDESLLGEEVKDIRPELVRIDNEIKELNLKIGQIITGKIKGDYKELKKDVQKKEREKKKLLEKPNEERNTTLDNIGNVKRNEAKIKLRKFEAKQKEFFNSFDRDTKTRLKKEMDQLEWELIKVTLEEQGNAEALGKLDKIMQSKSKPFFLWKLKFAEVFQRKNPGFDVVIANPPYVEFKNLDKDQKNLLEKVYSSTTGKYDLYIPFIEKSISHLSCQKGFITFICPTRFLKRDYGKGIRLFIKNNAKVFEIVNFTDYQVFSEAMTYTGIFSFINDYEPNSEIIYKKVKNNAIVNKDIITRLLHSKKDNDLIEVINSTMKDLGDAQWFFHNKKNALIINKMVDNSATLRSISEGIYQGIATGKDGVFVIKESEIHKNGYEMPILQKFLKGKDVDKYLLKWSKNYVIYPYDENGKVISENILKQNYPNIYSYLISQKNNLSGRGYFDKSPKRWFELWNQRSLNRFKQTKLLTLDNAKKNSFALDELGFTGSTTVYSIILKDKSKENYKYILALLNSKLMNYYHKNTTIPQAGGFFRYQAIFIENFPIKFNDQKHNIVEVVDRIITITKSADYLNNMDEQNHVKSLEKQINKLVYKTYELTDKEIETIEKYTKNE